MRFQKLAVAVCLLVMFAGCKKEETYKGKPLSAWIAQSKDADDDTRSEAILSLGNMRLCDAIRSAEKDAAKDSSSKIRAAAMESAMAVILTDEEAIALMRSLLNDAIQIEDPSAVCGIGFGFEALRLGPKGAALLPPLHQIREITAKRADAADVGSKSYEAIAKIDEVISDIKPPSN